MSAPKKAINSNSNSNEQNQFDWVKDSAGNQMRLSLMSFLAENPLVGIYSKPAKDDAPARAYLSVKRTDPKTGEEKQTDVWASREASSQIAKHLDAKTGKYTKGTLSGLMVGEYYVQDADTKERITDEDGDAVTAFRIVKPEGNFVEGINASDLF